MIGCDRAWRAEPANAAGPCRICTTDRALVSEECVRAIALMFFGWIALLPKAGTSCLLCHGVRLPTAGDAVVNAVSQLIANACASTAGTAETSHPRETRRDLREGLAR